MYMYMYIYIYIIHGPYAVLAFQGPHSGSDYIAPAVARIILSRLLAPVYSMPSAATPSSPKHYGTIAFSCACIQNMA